MFLNIPTINKLSLSICIQICLTLTSLALADPPPPQNRVRIGIAMPFSGDVAVFGEKARRGFELAEQTLSKDEFEIIYEDTGGSGARQAIAAVSKLIEVNKIDVLLGTYGPTQTISAAPIALRRQVPIFSYSLCSSQFIKFDSVYCSYPSVQLQLESLHLLFKSEQIRTISLVDESSEGGLEATKVMKENAVSMGYQILTLDEVNPTETDFRSIVSTIKLKNPDAIFVAVTDPARAFTFIKQLHDTGYRGKRIAFIDYDDKYLTEFSGVLEGVYIPGALPNNFGSEFAAAYRAAYHETPDLYSALAYDMLNYVAQAINNGRNQSNLKLWINQLSSFQYINPAVPGFGYLSDRTVKFPLELRVAKGKHFVTVDF